MTQDVVMMQDEQTTPTPNTDAARNQLQQFCALAKAASGPAILELVQQVLEAPGVYVFAELIEMPNIQDLKIGPNAKYINTLTLFAYGTYKLYLKQPSEYIELTAAMKKKLQHLTLVSLAIKTKCIPYELLLDELDIDNVRRLEDLIIEAIYADIIHGKLFQNNRFLEVDYAQGRDIPPGYTTKIAETLQNWVESCDAVGNCISEQITFANIEKAKRWKNKENVEIEILHLRKVLKNQIADSDDTMQIDSRETTSTSFELRKKTYKAKPVRPTGSLKFSK